MSCLYFPVFPFTVIFTSSFSLLPFYTRSPSPFLRGMKVSKSLSDSSFLNKKIKKVAVLGGSGSFAIGHAKRLGANAFLTADLKYHQFYEHFSF